MQLTVIVLHLLDQLLCLRLTGTHICRTREMIRAREQLMVPDLKAR